MEVILFHRAISNKYMKTCMYLRDKHKGVIWILKLKTPYF